MQSILEEEEGRPNWSQRAVQQMTSARQDFPWIQASCTALVDTSGSTSWWTFAGRAANNALAGTLTSLLGGDRCTADNLQVIIQTTRKLTDVEKAIHELTQMDLTDIAPEIDNAAISGLKFSECLPEHLAIEMLQRRSTDEEALRETLAKPIRSIVA